MQTLEEIEIIIHTLHSQQFWVIRPVVAEKGECFIDGFTPEDITGPIGFDNILRVGIGTILEIILEKEQHNRKHIKCTAIACIVVHTNNLFLGIVFFQNLQYLFQFFLGGRGIEKIFGIAFQHTTLNGNDTYKGEHI